MGLMPLRIRFLTDLLTSGISTKTELMNLRINPLHENTCHNRIGMYREGQCTDGPKVCPFLDECDYHYDGEWDYPKPILHSEGGGRAVNFKETR